MKAAWLYVLGAMFAVLLARRTMAAPGMAGEGAGWVTWPFDDVGPYDANQAGTWADLPVQSIDAAYPIPAWVTEEAGSYPVPQWVTQNPQPYQVQGDTVPDQLPGVFASALANIGATVQALPQALGIATPPPPDIAARNERAFLDMIAFAEGTAGPDGYRTMFGGGLFDSFADHPRVYHNFRDGAGRDLRTSAAGRYQFLARTWDTLRARLNLPDFGPASQDAAALDLVRERGALADVRAGRVTVAVTKVAPIWASLPGAGYAQPERKLTALIASYSAAGGNLEA